MEKLSLDILYLVAENLHEDSASIYSFLLVNRIWCKIAVPILWKIPGRCPLTEKAMRKLFKVVLSHLPEDIKEPLRKQKFDAIPIEDCLPTIFNYIKFWRYLDLGFVENMIALCNIKEISLHDFLLDELLKLFINKSNQFVALYIPFQFKFQSQNISWAEECFSNLKFLNCDNSNKLINKGLASIAKSIRKFIYYIINYDEDSLILIENQNILYELQIECHDFVNPRIESLLIEKAGTINHLQTNWNPEEMFFSNFENLKSLKIGNILYYEHFNNNTDHYYLEYNTSIGLGVFKADFNTNQSLDKMIEIMHEHLVVITIWHNGIICVDYNKRLLEAIHNNCPKLRYLNLPIKEDNIPEFEKILIKCQNLSGLIVENETCFQYKSLFSILTSSSSTQLNKFKFRFNRNLGPKYEILKSFLNNWKNRQPMFLQIDMENFTHKEQEISELKELINEYEKAGIVQKWDIDWSSKYCEFEWVSKKSKMKTTVSEERF